MQIFHLSKYKPKIVIFQGSPRNEDSCPDMESKTAKIIKYAIEDIKDKAQFDICDLSVKTADKKAIIQPCKGCISTAGGYHCHYPCSCYKKDSERSPDLMYNDNIYERLETCDGFIVFSPIHWYNLSTPVKSLFDRLVCINLTLTSKQALELKIMDKDGIKDSKVSGKLNKSKKFNELLVNHYAGKFAGFFAHGDNGADDYKNRELPESMDKSGKDNIYLDPLPTVMPYVLQCRYSGIFVPDDLIFAKYVNEGTNYYHANELLSSSHELVKDAKKLINNMIGKL